jgi:hypothetical protein
VDPGEVRLTDHIVGGGDLTNAKLDELLDYR